MEGEKINGEIISLVSELHKKIRLEEWGYSFWLKALGRNGNLKSFDDVYSYFKKDVLKSFPYLPNWYKEIHEFWNKKNKNWCDYKETYLNKLIMDFKECKRLKT